MAADLSPHSGTPESLNSRADVAVQAGAKSRVAWAHVVLGFLGVAAGIYAVHLHALVMAGQETGCGISESISCDKVIGSQYGEFFGIPLGVFGALFWAIVIVTAISGAATPPRVAALQRLGVATVGLLTSLVLAYISLGVLHKFCPVCATTHTLSGINFLVAAFGVWRLRGVKTSGASAIDV